MDEFERLFTLEEANTALEDLRPLVEELMACRDELLAIRPEVAAGLERARGNGGTRATATLITTLERIRGLVDRIQETGALVKDIDSGLLDFPSERGGQVVFLCWKFGETSVGFWHDLEDGFAGRQPI